MTKSCHDQLPKFSSKSCRFLSSSLKDAFSNCHTCKRSRSVSSHEDETPTIPYFNDELEVVSIVRARAKVAKLRRKSIIWNESFSSVFYPVTLSELFIRSAMQLDNEEDNNGNNKKQDENNNEEEDNNGNNKKQDENNSGENEEFLSVMSHFSSDGSTASEFLAVKTSLSECSSFKEEEEEEEELFSELRRRSIIQEFSYCKGWPFGLCKRVILLPPLPKSPSDSWSWCNKRTKITTH